MGYIKQAREKKAKEEPNQNQAKFRTLIDIMLEDQTFNDLDVLHEVSFTFSSFYPSTSSFLLSLFVLFSPFLPSQIP